MKRNFFGVGSIKNLRKILNKENPEKIFLVTGKKSYQKSGAKSKLKNILKNYDVFRFYNFQSNPNLDDVKRAISLYKKFKPDLVVSIGGGSVIDMAKSVNLLSSQPFHPKKYLQKNKGIHGPGKKLIAIPTTAGTGSEATHFATIYIGKTKYSLTHEFVLPNYSIVDPQFTFSLPPKLTAITGLDALAHSMESYWNVNSTEKSKSFAKKAIILALKNIAKAVKNPSISSRVAMSKAANLAGKAINITKTTACHAISYPMTSYFNVPHGQAVAVNLPSMLVFNSKVNSKDVMDKRGVKYVKQTIENLVKLLDATDVASAKKNLEKLISALPVESKLENLGIKSDKDIEVILRHGFNPDRVKNNPRKLTKKELKRMLGEI